MPAALQLSSVTLSRRTQEEFHYDLKRTFLEMLHGRMRRVRRRTVLHDVSISVQLGEKIAIVGANGSGKSTMLKVIAGVLKPNSGSVRIHGTVAPLIELGVGFEPELSLIDNIIYYGVLLGHPEGDVRERVAAILDFAELTEVREEPTKTLSSGMAARLAFAIATEFRPDILLLDEVLSVGDERFRRKCSERLERFWDAHSTIVMVSHDLAYVARSCDRAIWIDHGTVRFDGATDACIEHYLATVPTTHAFATGQDLIAVAERNPRGEIVVRGTSPTDEGEKVFLVRDGRRHMVGSSDWYSRVGYVWDDIVHVENAVLLEIPEGEVLV